MGAYTYPGLNEKKYVSIEQIITTVCNLYEIDKEMLFSRKRTDKVPEARRVCFFLVRKYLKLSYDKTGAIFKLDHSTAIHHIRKFEDHYEVDKAFRTKVQSII